MESHHERKCSSFPTALAPARQHAAGAIGLIGYAISKFTSGKAAVIGTAAGFLGMIFTFVLLVRCSRRFSLTVRAAAMIITGGFVGAYLVLFPRVYFFQDAIANNTSAFFQPRTISTEDARAVITGPVSSIQVDTPDGIGLEGWLIRNSPEGKVPLLIYLAAAGPKRLS